MTTPAVQPPAPRKPAAVPSRPAGYTHRTWRDEMRDVLEHVAEIYFAFQVMNQTLDEVMAGETQVRLVAECHDTALTVLAQGFGLVKVTDEKYLPIFDAIERAGGQREVAKDKRYHDTV